MKEHEVPSEEQIRERVFAEVERLQKLFQGAREPGRPNRFSWLDAELWVDRKRWLVLAAPIAEELGALELDTVPVTMQDEVRFEGVRASITPPRRMIDLLATFINGIGPERGNGPLAAELINFAAVQPLVNPAFASLFWLGLEAELRPYNEISGELGAVVGQMAFDMSRYPESRVDAANIRAGQVRFVQEHFEPQIEVTTWQSSPDDVWAKHCATILQTSRAEFVFREVWDTAGRQIIDHAHSYV